MLHVYGACTGPDIHTNMYRAKTVNILLGGGVDITPPTATATVDGFC